MTRALESMVMQSTTGDTFRPQDHEIRPQDHGTRLADVVTFRWEMVTDTGEVAAGGLEFVVLGADGRIRTDYQALTRALLASPLGFGVDDGSFD
jgi:hypothetical protein